MDKRNTARCDEMEPKNRFSTLLEHLMSVAALKHYVVAQALQYDVSYISKWIGGKALPAEKSAEDVLRRLSRCLVEQGEPQGLVQLIRDYQVQDEQELSLAIYDNLMAEYNYVRELQRSSGAVVAPNVAFYPQLPLKNFIGKIHGRLVPDFQYDVHPCMFLNETGATLRLEGCDQVLHVNRPEMAAAYLTFFEEIWNGEAPVVVQEPEQIRQYLAHLLQNVRMLADIQPQNGEENK